MELLTVQEVATCLKISVRQVWKLLSAGRLPRPLRLARSVRFRATDIKFFVEIGCPSRAAFEAACAEKAANT